MIVSIVESSLSPTKKFIYLGPFLETPVIAGFLCSYFLTYTNFKEIRSYLPFSTPKQLLFTLRNSYGSFIPVHRGFSIVLLLSCYLAQIIHYNSFIFNMQYTPNFVYI